MTVNTAKLYPYPTVQYIPLLTSAVAEGPWTPPPGQNRPALYLGLNDVDWREMLRRTVGLVMPPLTLASGELLLLALNMRPLELKYRGNFVTVATASAPGWFQLLRLNQRLFYKEQIIFEAYGEDGSKLCWQSWKVNETNKR